MLDPLKADVKCQSLSLDIVVGKYKRKKKLKHCANGFITRLCEEIFMVTSKSVVRSFFRHMLIEEKLKSCNVFHYFVPFETQVPNI